MVQKNWWIWLLMGTLLGILLMVLLGKGCNKPRTIPSPPKLVYKTDTIRLKDTILKIDTVPQPFEVVLPEKVYIYENLTDTIYMYSNSSPDPIWDLWGYQLGFLSKFRDKPKLLWGDFFGDSIKLSLMDTSGLVTTHVWPTFYPYFNYHFRNGTLFSTNLPDKSSNSLIPNRQLGTESTLYGFYSPFYKGFEFSADYFVTKGKFGLGVRGNLRTYSKYADLKLGIKYQLK